LKTNEDVASQSREMLQTFVWWVVSLEGDYMVGAQTCPTRYVRQLFQVPRVIQYQEFIVIYLSHPLTVRIVIR